MPVGLVGWVGARNDRWGSSSLIGRGKFFWRGNGWHNVMAGECGINPKIKTGELIELLFGGKGAVSSVGPRTRLLDGDAY